MFNSDVESCPCGTKTQLHHAASVLNEAQSCYVTRVVLI